MNNQYKSLIFTNHSLERLASRSITQDMVWQIVSNPIKKFTVDHDKIKFVGTVTGRRLHVVVQRLEKDKKWLVISTWVRGENDPLPFTWKIISFPFWLLWLMLSFIWKKMTAR